MDNHVTESMQWSKEEHNVETITLSAAEKLKWDGLLAPMIAEWIAEAKSKNLDGEAVVKDMKALIEKHSK